MNSTSIHVWFELVMKHDSRKISHIGDKSYFSILRLTMREKKKSKPTSRNRNNDNKKINELIYVLL